MSAPYPRHSLFVGLDDGASHPVGLPLTFTVQLRTLFNADYTGQPPFGFSIVRVVTCWRCRVELFSVAGVSRLAACVCLVALAIVDVVA